jgi:hypothetical protein
MPPIGMGKLMYHTSSVWISTLHPSYSLLVFYFSVKPLTQRVDARTECGGYAYPARCIHRFGQTCHLGSSDLATSWATWTHRMGPRNRLCTCAPPENNACLRLGVVRTDIDDNINSYDALVIP